MSSINPANGEILAEFALWTDDRLERALSQAQRAGGLWAARPIEERTEVVRAAAEVLRAQRDELARLISLEMGKPIREARGEIDKCAMACEYFAEDGPAFVRDEPMVSDARRSVVAYQPLGCVLAVMPWNFPFWQVFRFAAPALVAGNTGLLKHASNVPQCAQAIERVWQEAGAPEGVFTTLWIEAGRVGRVISDGRVQAVTLTGSEAAGRRVAAQAGEALKKTVLELGGSDAFVVLEDSDLEATVAAAVASRYQNAGQSCIAAKRFIVVEPIGEAFVAAFRDAVAALRVGDPLDDDTALGPLARWDLRDDLHAQVEASVGAGARCMLGGQRLEGPGAYYAPTVLDGVGPSMPAYEEELFGPVASVIRVADEEEALRVANDTRFGLGASVWTGDPARGERLARRLQCGGAFVNGIVKSDPRLPFGGVKASGYGRELSAHGMREFVNIKTLWIK
ncbi:NAD-dependent succinate-semialdehyde dehydrogenase [Ectothiorhodospiraceae bacterium 2226]|nr:NAD-dependent succinate-semialdehyde dehydrogenase [Ectothiorhodospiraceae bacterium 2226]